MVLQLLLLQLLWVCRGASSQSMALPDCPEKCGNVTIPYPFGFQAGCYKEDSWFNITCNSTFNPPRPFFYDLEILQITPSPPEMRLQNWPAYVCYNKTGHPTTERSPIAVGVGGQETPYTFSDKNRFIAVGCDTIGLIQGSVDREFTTGCLSICRSQEQVNSISSCSGIGCCQTQIPKGTKRFDFWLASVYNHTNATFNPCSYGFLADRDQYQFSLADLTDSLASFLNRTTRNVSVVIDWAMGNESCAVAQRNSSSYACGANTDCSEAIDRAGYLCTCKKGYEGNPYLPDGCQDVDECADSKANDCVENACKNEIGNYSCICPEGFDGDGRKDGNRCTKANKSLSVITKVLAGTAVGLVFLLFISSWSYWALEKRRLMKLREKFFKQNGGMLLQQQLSSCEGIPETTKIFSVEELEKATNNFSENQILGKGGYGTVYKGILSDHRVVAIKRSKVVDETQIEQFINEVAILTQINHRNVVKLLGCCLETEVPLLVYEYFSNGTLFQQIHREDKTSPISWDNRLRIAAETAEALAYLHSSASIPILHRDVKSANILLDDKYRAKVSDFGASRLVPMDKTQVTTLVQGTLGYLDPEYLHTSQLTDKSDVYSFGVVLVELLTGQLPLSFDRPEYERNLSMYFLSSMTNNRLLEILETRVVDEGAMEQLDAVAELAMRCLQIKGDERPSMKEVAAELQGLRRLQKHPWVLENNEEAESLLGEASHCFRDNTNGYDSLKNQELLNLEIPR